MDSKLNCCFSNKIEVLYEELKVQIEYNRKNPFEQVIIVVPSPAVKTWLSFQMASDVGIWMGTEINFLEQTLSKLKRQMSTTTTARIPSQVALSLAIQKEIKRQKWEPVMRYLEKEKKLITLSDMLAKLFVKYGLYGAQMIKEWDDHWQAQLWRRLFESGDYNWTYPAEQYTQDIDLELPKRKTSLYIFGMSYLSPIHHHFLCKLGELIPITYLLLSPCELFWSDMVSDRDSIHLKRGWQKRGATESQIEELDIYLQERHPLLANYGKLGREMAKEIEESDIMVHSGYHVEENPSLIEAVQGDMVTLEPMDQQIDNYNIKIHSATSKRREVEIAYDLIMETIHKEKILPEEIIVMAPDIGEYEPYIRTTFGSPLDYQIMDLSPKMKSPLLHGFLHLLKIGEGRWDTLSILQLFHNERFRKKFSIETEELETISEWITATQAAWGFSAEHREEILRKNYSNQQTTLAQQGTWEEATGLLLETLDPSQSGTLKKWIKIFSSLRDDLSPLEGKMPLTDWISYLKCLLESYFALEDGDIELIYPSLETLGQVEEDNYSFKIIIHYLEQLLDQSSITFRESHLHAVRFCSMLPMRAIPAQMIVLMGMDESSFPKIERPNSLDLMRHYPKCDYAPTNNDYDRFLFLEALLSTRKYFHILYSRVSEEDGLAQSPSILVEELQKYVAEAYVAPIEEVEHPSRSYDCNSISYSKSRYELAKAYYQPHKEEGSFVESYQIEKESEKKQITIKELLSFARNPLRTYFNQELGIYISSDKDKIECDEMFEYSPLDLYKVRQSCLENGPKDTLETFSTKLQTHQEPFKSFTLEKINDQLNEFEKALQTFGIDFEEIKSLEIELKIGQYEIVGEIELITPKGLLTYARDDKAEILRVWPLYLIYHMAVEKKDLLFIRTGKSKQMFGDVSSQLLRYLDYYQVSMKNASPVLPEWTFDFVKKDANALLSTMKEKAKNPFAPIYNDYLEWIMRNEEAIDHINYIEDWKQLSEKTFGEMYDAWF